MENHKEIIEYRYDTQLLLDVYGMDDDACDDLVDETRDYIIDNFKGDCLIVAGDTGEDEIGGEKATLKLHYHTNEPWLVLEYFRSLGEIYDIVVEDMQRQTSCKGCRGGFVPPLFLCPKKQTPGLHFRFRSDLNQQNASEYVNSVDN